MTRLFKSTIFKYIGIAALPLAVLLFQPATNFAVLAFGAPALLETRPIDPRDFLRGDYVTLGYVISDIPDALFSEDKFPEHEGETPVYVTLALDDKGIASVSRASFSRPSDGLYIRGRLNWWNVDYGIGVYYVPEGTGREIEDAMRDEDVKVLANVRILKGRAVIKKLEIMK
ncbi:MAG: GDYXXLXY domain-containing protein [Synergistaceae bacterium]|jgi:uncharacterized membrane-anchored protein|nr:GDYXXLXY domain-containing protein [Synergistaceae bacterium]